MKCPVCNKTMRKVRWEISNNFKMADQYQEYDKTTYSCKEDDVWVSTEIPLKEEPKTKKSK